MPTSLVLRTTVLIAGMLFCLGDVRALARAPLENLDLHAALRIDPIATLKAE